MNKLRQFDGERFNNDEQKEWYWDPFSLEEDITCHARRTSSRASKSKAKAKRIQSSSIRDMQGDNIYED